ncbi:AB hydrolase-1 domain-containing protein [Fusarium sp. LHS14.1]|nr:AB hydrolase-1 domain-containing protein [Fusarium sp. LHS14.1]
MRCLTQSLSRAVRKPCLPMVQQRFPDTTRSLSTKASSATAGEIFTLPSSRKLGYHTSGPATGTPIIYIHGHPDSGITITGPLESRIAQDLNIRWIGPDRPGVGLSTRYDSQEVLDYPADIDGLAKHLSLSRYYIIGTSGGTGFTLACAKDLGPSRLKGVGICAGIGPLECGFDSMDEPQRKALEAWRDYPSEFKEYYESEYVPLAQKENITALTDRLRGEFEASFTGRDLEFMMQESVLKMSVNSLRQAWIQGAWAHAKGMELHWQPWGFKLEDVSFPSIKLWYGGRDKSTTPVMGKYMADRLEGSVYKEFPEDSHYTIWREGNLEKIVRDLLEE